MQWSLRELARLGENDTTTTTPSTAVASMILHDVSLRLADQYNICQDLITHLRQIREGSKQLPTRRNGVIQAVNTNLARLDWKLAQKEQQEGNHSVQKALRDVTNLVRVHEDTFHLTFGLIKEQSNVLGRWSHADQHLVFATLEQVRSRHASTVETLADMVIDLRQTKLMNPDLDDWMDLFLRGRLGVQLLCDHYVSLHKAKPNGGVSVDCLLANVVDDAVTEAKHLCDAHYENIPDVFVDISLDARITIIRPWIHHVLVELLKNAMASSFEALVDTDHEIPPPIHVCLDEINDFVLLSVLDQGTGVKNVDKAFQFASSSVESRWDRLKEQQSYATVRSPLQSLGVGLPLSRMLLQHFGGDLVLSNRESNADKDGLHSGCTATIYLSTNEFDSRAITNGKQTIVKEDRRQGQKITVASGKHI